MRGQPRANPRKTCAQSAADDKPVEAASQRAVQLQAFSYQSLKSILKRSLDRQLVIDPEAVAPGPRHENLRGPLYYDPPTKLVQ